MGFSFLTLYLQKISRGVRMRFLRKMMLVCTRRILAHMILRRFCMQRRLQIMKNETPQKLELDDRMFASCARSIQIVKLCFCGRKQCRLRARSVLLAPVGLEGQWTCRELEATCHPYVR